MLSTSGERKDKDILYTLWLMRNGKKERPIVIGTRADCEAYEAFLLDIHRFDVNRLAIQSNMTWRMY